jgi:O-methyltransferase domain
MPAPSVGHTLRGESSDEEDGVTTTTTRSAEVREVGTDTGEKPPALAMTEMVFGYLCLGRTLHLVAELGIADQLSDGARTVQELAAATGAHPDALARCLRALASVGVFAEDRTGAYSNTPLSATLRQDAPVSLRGMAKLAGLPGVLRGWDAFTDAVRGDGARTAWELAHGIPLFEYLAANPADAAVFQEGMTAFSAIEAQAAADAYDFSSIDTLVDVGGGHGLLLATILAANPCLSGALFELPFVLHGARELLAEHGVADRCATIAGDFFEAVPAADAHILKNIVHDWDDERALAILRNCRAATHDRGRVLIVQEALPPGNTPSFGKLLDLQMLVIGGRERTEAEYRALLHDAGYQLTQIVPTSASLHVIEGVATHA